MLSAVVVVVLVGQQNEILCFFWDNELVSSSFLLSCVVLYFKIKKLKKIPRDDVLARRALLLIISHTLRIYDVHAARLMMGRVCMGLVGPKPRQSCVNAVDCHCCCSSERLCSHVLLFTCFCLNLSSLLPLPLCFTR